MENPLISIVIPAYNYGRFLNACIDSIVAQTYPNWELLVINNGSTDNTAEVLAGYTDPRIKKLRIEVNDGPVKAWAMGFEQCQGDYFALLPADDLFTPTKLQCQVDYLRQHPEVNCIGTYIDVVDDFGQPTSDHWMMDWINRKVDYTDLSQWHWKHHFCIPTALYQTNLCRKAGGIPLDGLTNICDWDFHVRLLGAGAQFEVIPKRLTQYRWHKSNTSHQRQSAHNQWIYSHTRSLLPALKERAADYYDEIGKCIESLYLSCRPSYFLEDVPTNWRCAHLEVLLNPTHSLAEMTSYPAFKKYTESWEVNNENRAAIAGMDRVLMTLRSQRFAMSPQRSMLSKVGRELKRGYRKLQKRMSHSAVTKVLLSASVLAQLQR